MRVNARLDDSYQPKLEYLSACKGLSVSDVIRESIDRYFESTQAEEAARMRKLDNLVGMIDDPGIPADLSLRYKDYLGESLERKYSPRKQAGE